MAIENGNKVAIEYTLALDDGTEVDGNVGEKPLVYEQGGNQILPALEEALVGLEVEEKKQVRLTPEQGYGPVDDKAFEAVPSSQVPEEAHRVGAVLVAKSNAGERPIRVHEVQDDKIVLDFNHPLAGQNLNFEVRIVGID